MPTFTFERRPCSVTEPGVEGMSSSSAAPTSTSSRCLSSWWGRSPSTVAELLHRRVHRVGVRDPGAVEAVVGLAGLVLAHLGQRLLGRLGVLARGDLRRHAAHRVGAAGVAGLDQQLGVGAHERDGHRHLDAVGQHEVRPGAEALDRAEDVVPAAGVQRGRALAQLVEDLVHLEHRGQRLDQDRDLDRAAVEAELLLDDPQRVVPQPRLEVGLELGHVQVGAAALLGQRLVVVGHVQRDVEQPAGHRPAVDLHVALGQVPAAGADQQRGHLLVRGGTACRPRRARSCRARRRPGSPGRPPCWPRWASWSPRSRP